ncbi:MAG: efflux transporter outer membrane subunit [Phycisphaerales bacterium]
MTMDHTLCTLRTSALLTAAAGSTLLVACKAVGPDYTPPTTATPEAFASTSGGAIPSVAQPLTPGELASWWARFQDPVLDALMQRAITNNKDLRVALERVQEARALRGVAQAGTLPTVDAQGSISRSRNSDTLGGPSIRGDQNHWEAGLDASWEIDVWGAVRRDVEAANADLGAAEENRNAAMVTVTAEVARNYVELRLAQMRQGIVDRGVTTQHDTVDLVRTRLDAGLGTQLELAQAQAQLASRESQKPLLVIAERAALNRLAVLVGVYPGELQQELAVAAPLPKADGPVATGVPSELLRRRPDIRAAERRIAGASARIGVATADLFPRFSLNGSFGLRSEELDNFADMHSRFWSFGPAVRWNIFDAGRVRRNIEAANARERQAFLTYEQTVLTSFEEVENALVGLGQQQTRWDALTRSIQANEQAVSLSQERYRSGVSEFLNVLESQRQLYDAEDAAAQSQGAVLTSLVALYKSLGGGWPEPAPSEFGPAAK